MNDETNVSEDMIEQIRAKPENQRTGEEQSILGIDNAVVAAQEALETAGFDMNHIILIFDAASTPDRTPDAAKVGMVCAPHHDECAVQLLGSCLVTLAHASGLTISGPPSPSGPIHLQ